MELALAPEFTICPAGEVTIQALKKVTVHSMLLDNPYMFSLAFFTAYVKE